MKYSRFFRVWTIAVILMIALVIDTPVTVNAERIILKVGPGHPYATIQDAVDDASPGSNIYVYPPLAPGPYYNESVSIKKNDLQIIAQGSGVIVIPTVGGDPSFGVYADHVVIRGFEMTGPSLSMGIKFEGSHNIFADNLIHPLPDSPDVNALTSEDTGGSDYNIIENNTIYDAGFAIRMVAPPDEDLNEGNIIRNNTIYDVVYGITVMNGNGFRISGNSITSNQGGHGIQIIADNNGDQGYHLITNNTLIDCLQEGIALYADNNTTLRYNLILANEVHNAGGHGIYLYADPDAKVENNSISNNKVSDNAEAGIYLMSGADQNSITKNSFMRNGSFGIAVSGNRNLFWDNTALENGEFDHIDWGTNNIWINNKYETAYLHPIFLPLIMLVQPAEFEKVEP